MNNNNNTDCCHVCGHGCHDAHGSHGSHSHDSHGDEGGKGSLIRLIIGALIFLAGVAALRASEANFYIPAGIFLISYFLLGGEILLCAARNIIKGRVFDENFLMSVATIGAFAIGEFAEAAAVMLFYQIGEYFQQAAMHRSRKSIAELMDIRPDYANVKRNGDIDKVSPESVNVGEHIIVKPGEKIPLDGVIVEGDGMLDTKSLTGESLPRRVRAGDAVYSGSVGISGLLTIEVTKLFGESTVAKIIDLVENASEKKAPTESFITKFSRYYTPAVVALAAMLAIVPPLILQGGWPVWIHRGLVFLVISCPCALVISIPLGFFGGIGGASRKGVLVKGGNYLEALGNLDIVVFDKTGTLTKGVFEVTQVHAADGYTPEQVLELAAYAECYSNHPIAHSILKAYDKPIVKDSLADYTEIAGHGVSVSLGGRILLAGNEKLLGINGISPPPHSETGTIVHVAVDGAYAGRVSISDEIKPDARSAILGLRAKGVRKAVMLTGDNASVAAEIAKELSLDEMYAGLLPHEKVEKLEAIDATKRPKGRLAFVGDGINDAPALARADIGIAMGGLGSDAAIEAADVVLMTDEPSKLVTAIEVAQATRRVVWQNIIFALGVKGVFLALSAFGIATMWEAVFADVGVALLAVLNATRIMRMR